MAIKRSEARVTSVVEMAAEESAEPPERMAEAVLMLMEAAIMAGEQMEARARAEVPAALEVVAALVLLEEPAVSALAAATPDRPAALAAAQAMVVETQVLAAAVTSITLVPLASEVVPSLAVAVAVAAAQALAVRSLYKTGRR
jgi:hypothetical protein